MTKKKEKAIVVGSGVAGLAVSIRLAHAGYDVSVFEANEFVGGKINSKQIGDYRFDMGPSIFTCPNYIKELYELCGRDFSEFPYKRAENVFNYFFPDGMIFSMPGDREGQLNVFRDKLGEDPAAITRYLDKAAGNYRLIAPLFIESSLHRIRHLMNRKLLEALASLPKYRLSKTMHRENKISFNNPKTVQLFNRFATYNGSSPFLAPAMLNMISHLEMNDGVFVPEFGMKQITDSLFELAKSEGVQFHLSEKVEEILVESKIAKGVRTKIGKYYSDVVVSNMDVYFTYNKLLPNQRKPKKILKQEKSSSAIVFYWGISKSFPELDLHNIIFSEDSKAEFDSIFRKKESYPDPTIYINITSKYVKGDAPEGHENWFAMINAPVDIGQDWDDIIKKTRIALINKINKALGTDLEKYITVEQVMDPRFIEKTYSGRQGSIYGNASNNAFSAFYRHPNFSKWIKGLYFVGVTVHPGGGIPLALNSAKIAVQCLKEDSAKK